MCILWNFFFAYSGNLTKFPFPIFQLIDNILELWFQKIKFRRYITKFAPSSQIKTSVHIMFSVVDEYGHTDWLLDLFYGLPSFCRLFEARKYWVSRKLGRLVCSHKNIPIPAQYIYSADITRRHSVFLYFVLELEKNNLVYTFVER